jgi:transposase
MTYLAPEERLRQLDELIACQARLNREIERQFGPIGGPLKSVTVEDRRRARALIADLKVLIDQMTLASVETEHMMRHHTRTTNASLTYLKTGRQLARRVLRTAS